ncbi:hypothetical protein TGDOM2_294650, partial [Toxoplasma gondii GAB2-2007-GAL-DOM2]
MRGHISRKCTEEASLNLVVALWEKLRTAPDRSEAGDEELLASLLPSFEAKERKTREDEEGDRPLDDRSPALEKRSGENACCSLSRHKQSQPQLVCGVSAGLSGASPQASAFAGSPCFSPAQSERSPGQPPQQNSDCGDDVQAQTQDATNRGSAREETRTPKKLDSEREQPTEADIRGDAPSFPLRDSSSRHSLRFLRLRKGEEKRNGEESDGEESERGKAKKREEQRRTPQVLSVGANRRGTPDEAERKRKRQETREQGPRRAERRRTRKKRESRQHRREERRKGEEEQAKEEDEKAEKKGEKIEEEGEQIEEEGEKMEEEDEQVKEREETVKKEDEGRVFVEEEGRDLGESNWNRRRRQRRQRHRRRQEEYRKQRKKPRNARRRSTRWVEHRAREDNVEERRGMEEREEREAREGGMFETLPGALREDFGQQKEVRDYPEKERNMTPGSHDEEDRLHSTQKTGEETEHSGDRTASEKKAKRQSREEQWPQESPRRHSCLQKARECQGYKARNGGEGGEEAARGRQRRREREGEATRASDR